DPIAPLPIVVLRLDMGRATRPDRRMSPKRRGALGAEQEQAEDGQSQRKGSAQEALLAEGGEQGGGDPDADQEEDDELPAAGGGQKRHETEASGERTEHGARGIGRISVTGVFADLGASTPEKGDQHRELHARDESCGEDED